MKVAGLQLTNEEKATDSDKLESKSFVISGTFNLSRTDLKKLIESNGGKNVGSLSGKTDYLIRGENMGPSKLEKAQKLNIPMISEQEFLDMIQ